MPLDDVVGRVVTNPGSALIVFPDQRLQGEIQSGRRSLLHQRCTALGISEDKHLLRTQTEPCTRGVPAEVDARKNRQSVGAEQLLKLLHGLRNVSCGPDTDDSLIGVSHWHSQIPQREARLDGRPGVLCRYSLAPDVKPMHARSGARPL